MGGGFATPLRGAAVPRADRSGNRRVTARWGRCVSLRRIPFVGVRVFGIFARSAGALLCEPVSWRAIRPCQAFGRKQMPSVEDSGESCVVPVVRGDPSPDWSATGLSAPMPRPVRSRLWCRWRDELAESGWKPPAFHLRRRTPNRAASPGQYRWCPPAKTVCVRRRSTSSRSSCVDPQLVSREPSGHRSCDAGTPSPWLVGYPASQGPLRGKSQEMGLYPSSVVKLAPPATTPRSWR